jgi:hypothetical protein
MVVSRFLENQGLISFEEITDYTIYGETQSKSNKKRKNEETLTAKKSKKQKVETKKSNKANKKSLPVSKGADKEKPNKKETKKSVKFSKHIVEEAQFDKNEAMTEITKIKKDKKKKKKSKEVKKNSHSTSTLSLHDSKVKSEVDPVKLEESKFRHLD